MLMRSKIKSELKPIDWIDSSELSDLGFSVARRGDREILIGVLDLSAFPTVEELQHQLRAQEEESARTGGEWFKNWFATSVANARKRAA